MMNVWSDHAKCDRQNSETEEHKANIHEDKLENKKNKNENLELTEKKELVR